MSSLVKESKSGEGLSSWDEQFLVRMKQSKADAIKSANTCRIEDTIRHAQVAAMTTQYMNHPGVSLEGAIKMKNEFNNMQAEIANALRKGCRL